MNFIIWAACAISVVRAIIWFVNKDNLYYTEKNLPAISFKQFQSLYPLAPDSWEFKYNAYAEYDNAWLEYTIKKRNPNYKKEYKEYLMQIERQNERMSKDRQWGSLVCY